MPRLGVVSSVAAPAEAAAPRASPVVVGTGDRAQEPGAAAPALVGGDTNGVTAKQVDATEAKATPSDLVGKLSRNQIAEVLKDFGLPTNGSKDDVKERLTILVSSDSAALAAVERSSAPQPSSKGTKRAASASANTNGTDDTPPPKRERGKSSASTAQKSQKTKVLWYGIYQGRWMDPDGEKCTVKDAEVVWDDTSLPTWKLSQGCPTPTGSSIEYTDSKGCHYRGTLDDGGLSVRWSDGSVWKRVDAQVAIQVAHSFIADNSLLRAPTGGLTYRRSKNIADVLSGSGAKWTSIVEGVDENDGWVRVGDKFLPTTLNDCRVLVPKDEFDARSASGAKNAVAEAPANDENASATHVETPAAWSSASAWSSDAAAWSKADAWSDGATWSEKADEFQGAPQAPVAKTYIADNSILNAATGGITYRLSKSLSDVKKGAGLLWYSSVEGVDEGDGWIKVGEHYLPTTLNGFRVVLSKEDFDAKQPEDSGAQKGEDTGADAEEKAMREKRREELRAKAEEQGRLIAEENAKNKVVEEDMKSELIAASTVNWEAWSKKDQNFAKAVLKSKKWRKPGVKALVKNLLNLKQVSRSELPKNPDSIEAGQVLRLHERFKTALDQPLKALTRHMQPGLRRRIQVGVMASAQGVHEARRPFDFVEATDTWKDVDNDSRTLPKPLTTRGCGILPAGHYDALAGKARDGPFDVVVKVSCVAAYGTKFREFEKWWPAIHAEKYAKLEGSVARVSYLWQVPPSFQCNDETSKQLESLCKYMSSSSSGCAKASRHVVDFRHTSWYKAEIYEILHKHRWCLAWLHLNNETRWSGDLPSGWTDRVQTTDFCFCRLFGPTGPGTGSYNKAFLNDLQGVCPVGTLTCVLFGNSSNTALMDREVVSPAICNALNFNSVYIKMELIERARSIREHGDCPRRLTTEEMLLVNAFYLRFSQKARSLEITMSTPVCVQEERKYKTTAESSDRCFEWYFPKTEKRAYLTLEDAHEDDDLATYMSKLTGLEDLATVKEWAKATVLRREAGLEEEGRGTFELADDPLVTAAFIRWSQKARSSGLSVSSKLQMVNDNYSFEWEDRRGVTTTLSLTELREEEDIMAVLNDLNRTPSEALVTPGKDVNIDPWKDDSWKSHVGTMFMQSDENVGRHDEDWQDEETAAPLQDSSWQNEADAPAADASWQPEAEASWESSASWQQASDPWKSADSNGESGGWGQDAQAWWER